MCVTNLFRRPSHTVAVNIEKFGASIRFLSSGDLLLLAQKPTKEGWAIAQSRILVTTITLSRLFQGGYKSMIERYLKVAPE